MSLCDRNKLNLFSLSCFWKGNQQSVLGLIRFKLLSFCPPFTHLLYIGCPFVLFFFFPKKESAKRLNSHGEYMMLRIFHKCSTQILFHHIIFFILLMHQLPSILSLFLKSNYQETVYFYLTICKWLQYFPKCYILVLHCVTPTWPHDALE